MPTKYRVDCRLAHGGSPDRTEPKYIGSDVELRLFQDRQAHKAPDDPWRLIYSVKKWDGQQYIPHA